MFEDNGKLFSVFCTVNWLLGTCYTNRMMTFLLQYVAHILKKVAYIQDMTYVAAE